MLSSRAAGQARPDAEIPVDVHYAKLASWLVDRKKAPADWRKRLAALHARVGELARKLIGVDMPVLPAGPVEQAITLARDGRALVVATGSVFLAGAVRELLGAKPAE